MIVIRFYYLFLIVSSTQLYCASWFGHDRAVQAASHGNWQKACEYLNKTLSRTPDDPALLYDAGVAEYRLGNFKQAHDYFKRVQLSSADASLKEKAWFNDGNAHAYLKDFKNAVEAYKHALEINPNDERVIYNLKKAQELLKAQKEQQKKDQEKKDNKQQDKDQNKEKQESQQQENDKKQDTQNNQQDQQKQDSQDNKQQGKDQDKDKQDESKQQGQDKKQDDKNGQQDEQNKGSQDKKQQDNGQGEDQQNKEKQDQKGKGKSESQDSEQKKQDGSNDEKAGQDKKEQDRTDGGYDENGQDGQQKSGGQEHETSPLDNEQQKGSQKQDNAGEKQEQALQAEANQESASDVNAAKQETKKVDKNLAAIMQDQEKRDSRRIKGYIKGMVGKQLTGQDGQHNW